MRSRDVAIWLHGVMVAAMTVWFDLAGLVAMIFVAVAYAVVVARRASIEEAARVAAGFHPSSPIRTTPRRSP